MFWWLGKNEPTRWDVFLVSRVDSPKSADDIFNVGGMEVFPGRRRMAGAELPSRATESAILVNGAKRRLGYAKQERAGLLRVMSEADLKNAEDESLIIRQPELPNSNGFPLSDFFSVPFTHHIRILEKVKEWDARVFYIRQTALTHLSKEALIKAIDEDDFHHSGVLPNNFLTTIPDAPSARRAIRAFKDEYLLDFINVEELDAGDIEDVDERVLENKIVENIRDFILKFGKDFLFLQNQYTIDVKGHTFKVDLLFFNRELNALVAVELKRGPFKTAYLGQLNGYLTVLDDYVRKPHENPSIGLVLCKSADKSIVEYLIKDYNKPMGVATFRTREEMPEKFRNALPDIEELRKLL